MSRLIVDQLLSMLDQSFERTPNAGPTDGWHSLMANLEGVRDEDWEWLPADNIYHAGEVNHIRALAQGNDAWPKH